MSEFTPWSALVGGAIIGLAASLLLWGTGRVAGISGIAANAFLARPGDRAWRGMFLAGLLAAGIAAAQFAPSTIGSSPRSLALVLLAGLLVGVGSRVGGGCTSGHGVCGVSRGSVRSIVATATFMAAGIITVALLRWLGVP